MTTYTRAQLVTEAAECLQIIGAGQSLDAGDGAKIDAKIDSLIERLSADEVVDIPDLAEIPAVYFEALAELLANSVSTKFGLPYSEDKRRVFEAQLRRTAAGEPSLETLRTEYF